MSRFKLVDVLKENPDASKGCPVKNMHEISHCWIRCARKRVKRYSANVWELFIDFRTCWHIRNTAEQARRFLSECRRDKDKVSGCHLSEWESIRVSKVFIWLFSRPSSTLNSASIIPSIPLDSNHFLPFKAFFWLNLFLT